MSAEYDRGFAAGVASRDVEVAALERVADYWYFRALNPGAVSPEGKMVNTLIQGMQENEERNRKRAELDAADAAKFSEARRLIAEGLSDTEVAVKVELFAPTVANIRAGAL